MVKNVIITAVINLILFILVIIARKIISNEPVSSFLVLKKNKNYRLFWEGSLIAFILIHIYVFLIIFFNLGEFELNLTLSIEFVYVVLAYLLVFIAVSLFEESLFRDYLLYKFRKRFGTEKAIVLSSILFSLLHIFGYLSSGNLTVIGLLNAFFIGILLSVVVISTHSIMWALGFHIFWNLIQTIFLEIEIGGIVLNIEKGIWAGTKQIPEAGLIVSIVLFILYIYILKRFDASYLIPKIKGFG